MSLTCDKIVEIRRIVDGFRFSASMSLKYTVVVNVHISIHINDWITGQCIDTYMFQESTG